MERILFSDSDFNRGFDWGIYPWDYFDCMENPKERCKSDKTDFRVKSFCTAACSRRFGCTSANFS